MGSQNAQCSALKKDGTACGFPRRHGFDYCFAHDPELAEIRREAQAKGGRGKEKCVLIGRDGSELTEVTFTSQQDVKGYLLKILGEVASRPLTDSKTVDLVAKLAQKTEARQDDGRKTRKRKIMPCQESFDITIGSVFNPLFKVRPTSQALSKYGSVCSTFLDFRSDCGLNSVWTSSMLHDARRFRFPESTGPAT